MQIDTCTWALYGATLPILLMWNVHRVNSKMEGSLPHIWWNFIASWVTYLRRIRKLHVHSLLNCIQEFLPCFCRNNKVIWSVNSAQVHNLKWGKKKSWKFAQGHHLDSNIRRCYKWSKTGSYSLWFIPSKLWVYIIERHSK